jgi:hypothetical protein
MKQPEAGRFVLRDQDSDFTRQTKGAAEDRRQSATSSSNYGASFDGLKLCTGFVDPRIGAAALNPGENLGSMSLIYPDARPRSTLAGNA